MCLAKLLETACEAVSRNQRNIQIPQAMSFAEAEQLALLGSDVQALSWTKKGNSMAEGLLCLCESAVNLVSVRSLASAATGYISYLLAQASSGKTEQSWALPTAQQKDCGRVVHIAPTGYVY